MGYSLFRPLQSAYELIGTEKINRLARGPWNAAAAAIWGLLGAPTSGAFWFGDAGKPSAGAGLSVNLAAGLGVITASGGGDFDHPLRPIIISATEAIPLDANSDPNFWDRIDLITIRALESEGESANASIRDPLSGNTTIAARAQRVALGYQYRVVKGVPAASPLVPATPAGYTRIGYVIVRNAAGSINNADVIDNRTPASAALGALLLTKTPWLRFGTESAFAQFMFAPESEGPLAAGDMALVTHNYDDITPDGVLRLGELFAAAGVYWPGSPKAAGFLTWDQGTTSWALTSGYGVKTLTNFGSFQRVTLELYGPADPEFKGAPLGFVLTTFGDVNESSWDSWDANFMVHTKYVPSTRTVFLQGYKLDVDSDYDPNGTTAFSNLFFLVM